MAKDPFNKYYLANFNDFTKVEELPNKELIEVWRCKWSTVKLEGILTAWKEHRAVTTGTMSEDKGSKLLCDAVVLALICVQYNFTGPFTQLADFHEVVKKLEITDCDPNVHLMENGEELNPNVKLGELLVLAKEMLQELRQSWWESLYLQWWQMRLICLQQKLLDELTSNLYGQFKTLAESLLTQVNTIMDSELEVLMYLELANGYLQFHRAQKSQQLLEELCQHVQVTLNVEGLLGMRTKFQQKPLPQLCLKVKQKSSNHFPASFVTNCHSQLPKLLLLDDDTRLERVRFIEIEDNETMALPSVLQSLVLTKVKLLKRSQPKDRLADEELEPYIQTLLYQQHGPLQVRQSALLLNCIQESSQRRTVERSWKQCEEAVKLLSEPTDKYPLTQRLSYAFASFLQPKWEVQLQLCELLLSLGMTKTALDIYLQHKAWPAVIDCYTRLELRHKAAEIIRQELLKKPSVLLHCLLGDAIDDPVCYETAWEFSKHTSAKAQAHWGNYNFRRREYEAAISHLKRSVEINSLQEKIWLRLGYAAIMLERWNLAVHAYITYTHLEPLGFESWNNLAKALIKLGDKQRAHRVLGEALKCNYSNWKVWENFMLVAVDTGHFEDALNAYKRLSELKERFLDMEVLCITISAIAQGKPDANGRTTDRLLKKANTLLGQQCIKHGNEPKVWELAALVAATPLNKAQKLVKAYRAYTTKDFLWSTKQTSSAQVLQLCRDMSAHSLEAISDHAENESESLITSQLNSARLSAQSCIRSMEKEIEKWPENKQLITEVEDLLLRITEVVKQRMGA